MKAFVQLLCLVLFVLSFSISKAQIGKMNYTNPNENFYDTQKRLNKHYKKHERELKRERKEKAEGRLKVGGDEEEELAGYELYKRWESYMEPRVYPSGDKTLPSRAYQEFLNTQQTQSQNKLIGPDPSVQTSVWQAVGPFGDPSGGNAGRVNAVRFDPLSSTGLLVCTPDGGLWTSANSGSSWATNTDQLGVIGNSDVVFDPTDPQVMYMATGDGDASDSYSIGVLKSTDGGGTWNATGLNWTVSQGHVIYKMLINPLNHNVLFAATSNGLYRTTDAGASWTSVSSGSYTDAEYKPGDTTTIYACTRSFLRSTNGGASFSTVTTGLPASSAVDRLAIAVTPADPTYVYIVAGNSSDDGFHGFYQSTNSGTSFSTKATSPNLMGWNSNGGDSGGQAWYTLSIAASPTNANEVVVGGVNIWRTTNAGTNWSLFGHWTGSGAPYVHADIHDLIYKNSTSIYAGTDGGIFATTNSGSTWSSVNGNMNIAEIYRLGLSKNTYNLAITGHQDNGTNLYTGGWNNTMGGDGMDCFIDWNNDQVMYGEYYNGSLNRTTNGGGSWTDITAGLTGNAAWVAPIHQDPLTSNTIYCGYTQLFKSTNQGSAWSQLGTISGSSTMVEFAVAPSNPQVIYVIQGNKLYKTSNGGTAWTNITGTLPVSSASLTWVTVEDDDPNSVWVTFSGYSSGNKVFASTNGGTSWTNYSTGLPNLPTNCITYWNGTQDGLYVGCDVGIYYRDSTTNSWAPYYTGLPNVSVRDIEIFYPLGKIRAATFGRGVWEADLYNNGTQGPLANFSADNTFICAGMTINFSDLSSFTPTSWDWAFQGGTPSTSTAENPSVVYNTPGTYSVSLTASNANGSDIMTKTLYITVSSIDALPLVEGFQTATFPVSGWQNYDDSGDNIKWLRSSSVGNNSTACMYFDNYNQDAGGRRDEMRTPKYDFSGFTSAKMYFDVAYTEWNDYYSDTLAILVSTDCGVSYTELYVKGGLTLSTTGQPDSTSMFSPSAAQWRTDTVSLNAFAGMGNVMVSFQNRGHYGQGLYIDNINITGANSNNPPVASFSFATAVCTGQSTAFTDQSTNNPTSWAWSFPGGSPTSSTTQSPAVTYTTSGTYTATLVATNSAGSSSPSVQTFTVNQTPNVMASGSSFSVCAGQKKDTLLATGATTYNWMPGNHNGANYNVQPSTPTVYTVTGTTNGCSDTATFTVGTYPLPVVSVTGSPDTICNGGSTTLAASGASTYVWGPATSLSSSTGSSVTASPTSSVTYTITGTDANGCYKVLTHHITVNSCTGIGKLTGSNAIGVYPNPNGGSFTIDIPENIADTYYIEIRNALGQLIHTEKVEVSNIGLKKNVKLATESKGIYTLIIQSHTGRMISEIVVD